MRTLLVGCGAIGSVMAAELTRAGRDLTVVTGNTETRDRIRERGLQIRDLKGEWSVRLPRDPVARASELVGAPPFDACLLATKTTTLEEAVREALPLLSPDASVVCLQNGLPEERVAAIVGVERVVGCVVGWGATLLGPGQSARTSRGGLQLGCLRGGREAAVGRVAALLGGPFETHIVEDLIGVRWSKLAINCATSTLGAVGGDTLGRLLSHRFVRRLALEVWAEICAVARAVGVRLGRVSGTLDIEQLALTERERRQRIGSLSLVVKHAVLYAVGMKFRRMRSSMLVALERGRRPEVDWLNGEVVRRGAQAGVSTPLNSALVELVHAIAAQRQRSGLDTLRAFYEHHVASA
ncbi:MAG: 2-dehydropantoate 2-reductase [Myxococcota bacterium]|nr:2-dehydropantoate 2-reductase [Myxococcota bacterium]